MHLRHPFQATSASALLERLQCKGCVWWMLCKCGVHWIILCTAGDSSLDSHHLCNPLAAAALAAAVGSTCTLTYPDDASERSVQSCQAAAYLWSSGSALGAQKAAAPMPLLRRQAVGTVWLGSQGIDSALESPPL